MPDTEPKRKPVFIEKIMPVKLLNEQVYYENGGNFIVNLPSFVDAIPFVANTAQSSFYEIRCSCAVFESAIIFSFKNHSVLLNCAVRANFDFQYFFLCFLHGDRLNVLLIISIC